MLTDGFCSLPGAGSCRETRLPRYSLGMQGGREKILCPSCGKPFFFWVPAATEKPKVKCYLCGKESFPRGEPAPAPPAPKAPAAAPKDGTAAPPSS